MKRILLAYWCSVLFVWVGQAQSDTTVLPYKTYLETVLLHHPMAQQADLQRALADAEWLSARGLFDPTIATDFQQKYFDEKLYYRHLHANVSVPTRLGFNVVGGYENTDGVFLNPENNTDAYGLWHIGLEANLLQGLLIDEGRTALRQAAIFEQMTQNERTNMLNNLVYYASLAYLEWQQYFFIQGVIEEGIDIAETYFEATKNVYLNGEKAAIDTLEAYIILQDRLAQSQENRVKLEKARQMLENFLWFDEKPLGLQTGTSPQNYDKEWLPTDTTNSVETILNTHPQIVEKTLKRSYLEVEQRLKVEKLKPKLKLKYNPLLATDDEGLTPDFALSNYKWGLQFSMPMLLRSERAAIQKGNIKLLDLGYEINNKRNQLQNKIQASLQNLRTIERQRRLQQQNVAGYRQLLEAETEKFSLGESSVFLLNKRQEKYIEGQIKLLKIRTKQYLEQLNYLYFSNGLIE